MNFQYRDTRIQYVRITETEPEGGQISNSEYLIHRLFFIYKINANNVCLTIVQRFAKLEIVVKCNPTLIFHYISFQLKLTGTGCIEFNNI